MKITSYETTMSFSRVNTQQGIYSKASKTKTFQGTATELDQFQMSSIGRRMSKLISASKTIGPENVKARLNHVNDQFGSLNLDEMNVEEMSREELEAKLTEVQETIMELRPNAEINLTDFEGKTDAELKATLNKVVDRVDTAKEELSTVKSIVSNLFDNDTTDSLNIEQAVNESELFDEVVDLLSVDGSVEAEELIEAITSDLEE